MKFYSILLIVTGIVFLRVVVIAQPLKPIGAIPSGDQLAWHQMEMYAFIHFNMNTFTGKEWGEGDEDPDLFKPDSLDCRQWASVLKKAGFKAIILTAKHHDGFCLWPSGFTEHSVRSSKWRGGKGDVLQELSDACREYGLKLGMYYSPWDRNNYYYGKPAYLDYMKNQLNEILSLYGDVFEVWFDGANGGKGYYGGAKEVREVDRQSYYHWKEMFDYVKNLQPHCVIFSDGGPDVRWVGNEDGLASETNWCTLNRDQFYPGSPLYPQLGEGHKGGTHWVPAEVDVSIRPGWYYHPEQDTQVKSLEHLMNIYYSSVGRNANLLLNVPVNNHGLISRPDSVRLIEFAAELRKEFSINYAKKAEISASCSWKSGKEYSIAALTDGDPFSYWVSGTDCSAPEVEMRFEKMMEIDKIVLQEGILMGQRIDGFRIEALINEKWTEIASGTTIGYKRILHFNPVKTNHLKITFKKTDFPIVLSEISIY